MISNRDRVQSIITLYNDDSPKSANTFYLDWRLAKDEFWTFGTACAHTPFAERRIPNMSVNFSLNLDPIADLWEGKWPDTGQRITPHTNQRLVAAKLAESLGFDVGWRLDPTLPVKGWQDIYRA